MKKLFFFILVFTISISTFALDFSAGIKGDLGWNKFIAKNIIDGKELGDSDEDYNYRLGGRLGVVLGCQFTKMFAFEPEFMIHFGNGYSIYEEQEDSSYYYSMSFTTIEMPLLFKIKFPFGPGYLALVTGPSLSYSIGKIQEETEISIIGSTSNSKNSLDFEDKEMKKLAVGFAVGGEYELPLNFGNLVLGGRWEIDLTNMYDNTNSPEGQETLLRRISLTPSIAYIFRF